MKSIRYIFFIGLLAFSFSCKAVHLSGSRPNIIFVMTDDQGPMLSCMGHPIIQTPYIDEFAHRSLRFNEFHVSPSCSPTRAAIMCGVHEFKAGVTGTTRERERPNIEFTMFPKLLQKAGYETGIFGKWHLGDAKAFRPAQRGFTESLIHGAGGIGQLYPGSCADFPPNRKEQGRYYDNILLHNEKVVQSKGYCTDVFFDAATAWMKKQYDKKQVFFAYISLNAPHTPLVAPKENVDRINKRHPGIHNSHVQRWGMIENIDDNFGKLMQQLNTWGVMENTLILFTTDNGMQFKDGKVEYGWTGGYKSGKTSPGEGGTHVPCYWYWRGKLKENVDFNGLSAQFDLYPTFCELAGVEIPQDIQDLDGKSLVPVLQNPKLKWDDRMLMIHSGRWKGTTPLRDSRYGVRTQRWRMVGEALYDIAADPYEKKDVASLHPQVMAKLNAARLAWWDEVRPMMINENKTWEGEAPYVQMYNEALKHGIPTFKINQ